MKGDSFYYFVTEHLYPRWIEMGIEFPVVLVIDGYSAHNSSKLFIWCKQHNILILLYPNSTHIMQVLDIGIFSPLKTRYKELHVVWCDLHPTENFTELEFIKVLKAANDEILKSATIISAWHASGLQPFDFAKLNLDQLVTHTVINGNKQISVEDNEQLSIENTAEPVIVVPINFDDAVVTTRSNGCDEVLFEVDINDQLLDNDNNMQYVEISNDNSSDQFEKESSN